MASKKRRKVSKRKTKPVKKKQQVIRPPFPIGIEWSESRTEHKSKSKSTPKLKTKSKTKPKPKQQKLKSVPVKVERKVKPRVKREEREPIGYLSVGDSEDYHTITHLTTDPQKEHYKNFSHLTRSPIKLVEGARTSILIDILDIAVNGHLKKMGLEYDDLRVFSFGVLFRPDGEEITPSLVSEIYIRLQKYKPQIIVADEERTGQNAILINFGKDNKMVDMEHVRHKFERIADELQGIYELLYDELACDIDWDVWWDTDEVMY